MTELQGMERIEACDGPEDLFEVLEDALLAQAHGQPVDELAAEFAMTALAGAQLVRAGMTPDAVEQLFDERDHQFRLTWKDDRITIEIEWLDGGGDPEAEPGDG